MPDKEKNKSVYKPTRTKSSVEDNYYTDPGYEKILKAVLKKNPNTANYGNTRFSKGKDEKGEYVSAWDPTYYGKTFGGLIGKRDEFYTRFYTEGPGVKYNEIGPKYKTTSKAASRSYNVADSVDEAIYRKDNIKLSGKKIPLTQGRHRGATIDEAIVDEAIKASKKKGKDVNDLLALMSRESTLGAGKTSKKDNADMGSLVSGWQVHNESLPYPFNQFLADNRVPGVELKNKDDKYRMVLKYGIKDSAAVEDYLNKNPQLLKKYDEKLKKMKPIQNSFEGALDYITKHGVSGYNPGDPDYSNKVSKDKSAVKNEKALQKYIKNKKFAYGGVAMNVDSPQEALFKMIRTTEEAGHEAGSDPLVAGLKGLGGMMISTGMSMAGSGFAGAGNMSGIGGFFQDNFGDITKGITGATAMTNFAKGGQVGSPNIEVEGEEMFETPQGQVGEFKGPSHENGGIPLTVKDGGVAKDGEVPAGTYIYPDSIKINGKSLADRKKMREKRERKIEDLLSGSSDRILKNTLNRVKQGNMIEDSIDRTIQASVKRSKTDKYADGGGIPPLVNFDAPPAYSGDTSPKSILDMLKTFELNGMGTDDDFRYMGAPSTTGATPTASTPSSFDTSGLPTAGDALGIFGNLYQAFKPLALTKQNRAGDTPNINPYDNYGNEALETLEGNRGLLEGVRDNQLNRNRLSRTASINRNNNSARGVNTQRALNMATDAQYGQLDADILARYAEQLMGVNNQIAGTQLDISGRKAQGEQYRDVSDRQDRDQYYTNLAKDHQSVGEALSVTGKNINQIKERGVESNFLNQMFDYVQGNLMNGTISQKPGVVPTGGRNANEVIADFKKTETYKSMSKEQKEQFNNQDALSLLSLLGMFK